MIDFMSSALHETGRHCPMLRYLDCEKIHRFRTFNTLELFLVEKTLSNPQWKSTNIPENPMELAK